MDPAMDCSYCKPNQGFRMPLNSCMRTSQADGGLQNAHNICLSDNFGRTACLRELKGQSYMTLCSVRPADHHFSFVCIAYASIQLHFYVDLSYDMPRAGTCSHMEYGADFIPR